MLKIALVGCGGMAQYYRRIYTQIPGAQLAVVVDANEEVARNCAGELGVEVWGTDFSLALAPEIGMVDVSTPNHLHAFQSIAALEAGKHVLVQKPMAPTVREAEQMVAAARSAQRQLGIYMWLFDNPMFYELKNMIQKGLFGEISQLRARGAHRGGLTMVPGTWRGSGEKTGGGSFIQLAIHPLNMALWLLDDSVTKVAAFSKNLLSPNVGGDDLTAAVCEFASGRLGLLDSAYCAGPNLLELYGTRGNLKIRDERYLELLLDEDYRGELILCEGGVISHFDFPKPTAGPVDQHRAFVAAIMEGKPVPIPGEVGLRDLRIVEAVYRSAKTGQIVEVG